MAKTTHRYEYRAKEKSKNYFEEDFFKLISKAVFGKIIAYVRRSYQQNQEGITLYQNQTMIQQKVF